MSFALSTPTENNNSSSKQVNKIPDTPRPSILDSEIYNQSICSTNFSDPSNHSNGAVPMSPRMSLSPESVSSMHHHYMVSFDLSSDAIVSIPLQMPSGPELITENESLKVTNLPLSNKRNSKMKNSSRVSMLKCRICLDFEKDGEKLVSPCRCKGTVGLMHSSCLNQWIEISANEQCEICKCAYDMRKSKPTCMMWLEQIARQKSFLGDVLCFLFLVPSTITAVYFCVKAALFLFLPETSNTESQAPWRGMGLLILAMILIFCLVIWIVFTFRNYLRDFYNYQNEEFRYSIHNRQKSIKVTTLDLA